MLNISGGELLIILLVALVFLGPERLPSVARQVGQTVSTLRGLARNFQAEIEAAAKPDQPSPPRGTTPAFTGQPQRSNKATASSGVDADPKAAPTDSGGPSAAPSGIVIPSADDMTAIEQPDDSGETEKPAGGAVDDATGDVATDSLAGTFAAPTDVSELRKRAQEGGSFGGKAKPVSKGGPRSLASAQAIAPDEDDPVSKDEAPASASRSTPDGTDEIDDSTGTSP